MQECSFEALGTHWQISVDSGQVDVELWNSVQNIVQTFDERFSRFIETSEACAFRHSNPGTYSISQDLADLLRFAQELRQETQGGFDPAVGTLLEQAGYDSKYSFQPKDSVKKWQAPGWSVQGTSLTIDAPVVFDVGAFGKGACIDLVAAYLLQQKYPYFCVDGGGDMVVTTKQNGDGWNIALEFPGKADMAMGTVTLKNCALAVSDIYKRRWADWNHIVDPRAARSKGDVVACSVIAKTCQVADGLTTALSMIPLEKCEQLAQKYDAQFVRVDKDMQVATSDNWSGEFFV